MEQGEDGPGREDARIAEAFGMTTRSLGWRVVIKSARTGLATGLAAALIA